MLAERVIEWTKEWKDEGIQEGIQEGIERGIERGGVSTAQEGIIDILEAKFKFVAKPITEKINSIRELNILKTLLKKAATIESVEKFEEILNQQTLH